MKKESGMAFPGADKEIRYWGGRGTLRHYPLPTAGGGNRPSGHVLEARWEESAFFYAGGAGRAVLSPSGDRDVRWRIGEAGEGKPFSETDPQLDPRTIAAALAGAAGESWESAASEILPAAERFLAERFDGKYLGLPIGRRPTAAEYAFVAGNPERMAAVSEFPFLLPYLTAGLARPDPGPAQRIVAAVDAGGGAFVGELADLFGVDAGSVLAMRGLPAWLPTCYAHAVGAAETDPATYARAISLIAPDDRPEGEGWRRFRNLVEWAESVLWDSGDFPDRRAVPEAVAAVWKRIGRRPDAPLTDQGRMTWRYAFSDAADVLFPGEGEGFEGILQGRRKVLRAGAWSMLAMLCSSDPEDLAGPVPYSCDAASVRDVFGYAVEQFGLVPSVRLGASEGARK